jgi:phage terminase small subunit
VGERGPSRKPTELKLLRGETRKERLNPNRPRPAGTGPTMPADMDRRAKAVWQRQIVRDNAMLIRLIGRDLGFAPGAREGIQVGGAGDEELTPFEQWEAGAG